LSVACRDRHVREARCPSPRRSRPQLQQDISSSTARRRRSSDQIASLQTERTKLLQDVATATNARDAIVNQIDQLAATNKTQALLIDSYRNEVTKLRENELTYRKREIELVDRVNDLESQTEVQGGNIRALQEQLVECKRLVDAGGGAGSDSHGQRGVLALVPRERPGHAGHDRSLKPEAHGGRERGNQQPDPREHEAHDRPRG
jgi:hypothetical protein